MFRKVACDDASELLCRPRLLYSGQNGVIMTTSAAGVSARLQVARAWLHAADPVIAGLIDRRPDYDPRHRPAKLTQVPGIGPWTVQGALILGLNREDVVLPGDLALRKAVRDAYQLDHLPTPTEVLAIAERWRPYRSLATLYLFRAGESTVTVNGSVPVLDDAKNVTDVG